MATVRDRTLGAVPVGSNCCHDGGSDKLSAQTSLVVLLPPNTITRSCVVSRIITWSDRGLGRGPRVRTSRETVLGPERSNTQTSSRGPESLRRPPKIHTYCRFAS